MAAQQAADSVKDAVQNVVDKVSAMTTNETNQPNLVLDEVTGERVSKSEFKKRVKAREKEAKRAEAAASRPAPPAPKRKAGNAEEEEANLNPNVRLPVCDAGVIQIC